MTKNIKYTLFACGAFLGLWALCLLKIPPSFLAGDSPETIISMNCLGIQHLPGYALNSLLGKVFR